RLRSSSPLCFRAAAPPPSRSPLSLHDALPIFIEYLASSMPALKKLGLYVYVNTIPLIIPQQLEHLAICFEHLTEDQEGRLLPVLDRKSTRLNSSHVSISYAVFCLKKKTLHRTQ